MKVLRDGVKQGKAIRTRWVEAGAGNDMMNGTVTKRIVKSHTGVEPALPVTREKINY
jgi:hypothetical protein